MTLGSRTSPPLKPATGVELDTATVKVASRLPPPGAMESRMVSLAAGSSSGAPPQ